MIIRIRRRNYDTHLTYSKLDAWAKFKDFQPRIRNQIIQRGALDRIMIGLNGKTRAATSDRTANPLLQDVAIGWLQKYRNEAASRVMAEVKAGTKTIKVGESVTTADGYKNLDALVFDAVNNLLEPWFQGDTKLVAIVGADLLADKYFPLINNQPASTEKLATDLIISQKRIGGLQAMRVPFMPAGAIFITRLDNLSLYYQNSARRRTVIDNAKRDRIEIYESSNDAFVIENYGAGCLIENIAIVV